ncbi:hypothetical protein [Altericista sp. CCNU0014]|uniref:hypothetical protein n=1 Tax=Altericista sp. CCNU0014 TaxID=3082949 RepID=UPI00384D4043
MTSPYSAEETQGVKFPLAMVAIAFANAPRLEGRSPLRKSTCDRSIPGAWAKDAIAYSERCDRPSCPETKPGDSFAPRVRAL